VSWARVIAVLASVLPLDVCLAPAAFAGALTVIGLRSARADVVRHLGAALLVMAGIFVAAYLAPLKYDDRSRVTLPSRCVAMNVAMQRLGIRSVTQEELCFSSATPLRREVVQRLEEALDASGLRIRQLYCGSGVTLLFGAYPLSARLEAR
jgi:hypothetical protein